jgi:hypothetical protein
MARWSNGLRRSASTRRSARWNTPGELRTPQLQSSSTETTSARTVGERTRWCRRYKDGWGTSCALSTSTSRSTPATCTPAEAAQGRFWQVHDLLFEYQGLLAEADLRRYARELGLDLACFAGYWINEMRIRVRPALRLFASREEQNRGRARPLRPRHRRTRRQPTGSRGLLQRPARLPQAVHPGGAHLRQGPSGSKRPVST